MITPEIERWLIAAAILAGFYAGGWVIRAVLLRRLAALFARTTSELDDLVLNAVVPHVPLWLLLGGVVVAARVAPVPDRALEVVDRISSAVLVLSLAWVGSRLGTGLLNRSARRAGATVAATSLMENLVRAAAVAVGLLLVLSNLGLSITPLLTALGVGSLAVALALQPTLSNLFAGLHITLARPLSPGDFVMLETGAQGYVEDIGWRATRIRELPNNVIIVPNSRIAEMVLTNYNMPLPEQAALVQVGVAYGANLQHVEAVTCEVAREVLRDVEGGVAEFEPFIRYHTFGDSSINFTVILRVRQFVDRYLVTHEFIKRLKDRYDRERIEIPFPQRVLHAGRWDAGLSRPLQQAAVPQGRPDAA